jgi:hypothetical protein
LLHATASLPQPGTASNRRAGLTARPRPAASTRTRAFTAAGSDSARRRATRPLSELPIVAARSTPRASRKLATKRSKKAGE